MNNEIKEINIPDNILATLGDLTNGALNYYKTPKTIELKHKLLLDYITNLQKENEDYKSRCEKADEYIKENKDKYYHDWGEDDGSYDIYLDETEIDKLSNILNGGDE